MKRRGKQSKSVSTAIGRIPAHWTVRPVTAVADVVFSSVDKKHGADEQAVRLCNYMDVFGNDYITRNIPFMDGSATHAEIEKFSLRAGDVIVTKDSETAEEIAKPAVVTAEIAHLVCGYHLARIRPKAGMNGTFLMHAMSHPNVQRQFIRLANGITRFGLPVAAFDEALVFAPPTNEQDAIAAALTLWDEQALRCADLLAAKQLRHRALMRDLLTGERRVPKYKGDRWPRVGMAELLERVYRPVAWSESAAYDLISIRRRSGGLFHRGRLPAQQIKTKDLNRIEAGDFLVSKRQVTHGALAMVREPFAGMHVSNEYAIFVNRAPDRLHMPYFDWLSRLPKLWHLAHISSNGVHIEKLIFDPDDFLRHPITIPPTIAEQRAITAILDDSAAELRLEEERLAKLKEQKRGLLQHFFE